MRFFRIKPLGLYPEAIYMHQFTGGNRMKERKIFRTTGSNSEKNAEIKEFQIVIDDLSHKVEQELNHLAKRGAALELIILCQKYYGTVDGSILIAILNIAYSLLGITVTPDKGKLPPAYRTPEMNKKR